MARLHKLIIAMSMLCFFTQVLRAQTIYYPQASSRMLKETAMDMAMLLQQAVAGSVIDSRVYSIMPLSGMVLVYDSSITDNQLCKVSSTQSLIIFKAAQDNGLIFGVYQYLKDLGFNFYQPGELWQNIPTLSSIFNNINKEYNCRYKYKTWFITGGHNRWVMDANNNYNWDFYFGENGHNWALYQRRNGMMGAYRFTGHRNDILTTPVLNIMENNPCYVACFNGSRQPTTQSAPNVFSSDAMDVWAGAIEQKYTQYRTAIYGNKILYADLYRNYNYYQGNISTEVSDGAHWINSTDNLPCNFPVVPSPALQHSLLSNHSQQKINALYPSMHTQVYAYSSHAGIPVASILLNNKTDVQIVPTAFQSESSSKGLMNRWYKKHSNISEYHYFNITQWGGETPMVWYSDLQQTLQRLKEQHSQGIVWEASPAKFASLPFLKAANENLLYDKNTDSSINEFCNSMFGAAGPAINTLLKQWSNESTLTTGGFMADNKYKLPLYFQLLNEALIQASGEPEIIQQRLKELKCYLHYRVLYYNWFFDQRSDEIKTDKAATLCLFLASIHKLQLVNSYFLISNIVNHYSTSSAFYAQYNVATGTKYMQGNLPLISTNEIDSTFQTDLAKHNSIIANYHLPAAEKVAEKILSSNIKPLSNIAVNIGYNNGAEYPGRSEFFIKSKGNEKFIVNYVPSFKMDAGTINFTVEAAAKAMDVIFDKTIFTGESPGSFTVVLAEAGTYKFSVVSKWQSSVKLQIQTNQNLFYKNTAFLGTKIDNYRDAIESLPGFFYVPPGMQTIFFSIHNAYSSAGFASAASMATSFKFKDNSGQPVMPQPVANDPALFYLSVPAGKSGTFWQATDMAQYELCFANISNQYWFAERASCSSSRFAISIKKLGDNCITHLTALDDAGNYSWEISDISNHFFYSAKEVDLPDYISPNAVVSLVSSAHCSSTKFLKEEPNYHQKKEACASGAFVPGINATAAVFPNPSAAIFYIQDQDGSATAATHILVLDVWGRNVLQTAASSSINLKNMPAGIYFYKMIVNEKTFTGKLIKL